MFRYCTKQTIAEIRKLDAEDKRDLDIFDLPIPIAIFVVIAWIFVCSATFCIWEHDWDYFVAFYFFFISLSTIGLGDITPTQPKYLLMLFIYIIIGLSLVSMCINLIQAKLERTYEAGRMQELELETVMLVEPNRPQRRGSSLDGTSVELESTPRTVDHEKILVWGDKRRGYLARVKFSVQHGIMLNSECDPSS
ncbi:unnamed protein product [Heligmosomoides polygyrus]|uniref:Ion_trans_2 domain-containing protein n=1 Tax=Heligmosomoides polygyrus TaxID=6339 RepID=A0A3P7XNQ3_HELPZ|nr:unnamed protein product [Heligmosomoides polygyrus]